MNLHHRALSTLASPEQHTFKIINVYTGRTIECKLARETKCYYVMWSKELSGGRYLERRFHKATMSNDELSLFISDTAEDKATARAEVAQRIEAVKVREALKAVDTTGEANLYIAAEAAPIAHDAPHFCPACETYVKADEMTASAWVTMLICIDCANDEADAITATKTVLVHNQHDGSTYDAEILKSSAQCYTVLIHAGPFGDLVRPFPFDTLHNAHLALEVRGDVDTVCHVIDVETNNQFRAVLFSETTRFYTVDVFGWDGVPTRHHFSKIRMLSRDLKLAISRA